MNQAPRAYPSGPWSVRPANSTSAGTSVSLPALRLAIEREEVGDLDEVKGPQDDRWMPVAEHPLTAGHVPRPRKLWRRDNEDLESDMTPMIDVTFQLLIFFMIAATYVVHKTLDFPTSQPQEQGASAVTMEELQQDNIIVKVTADGTITVDDEITAREGLEAQLRKANAAKKSTELVLDVADEALHDVVVAVLDAAGGAQIEKVLFVKRVPATAAIAP